MSAETGPLGGLPAADRNLLVEPPLELAVAEIRFLGPAIELPSQQAIAIREALTGQGFSFPRLEQAQQTQVSIEMSAGMPSVPMTQQSAKGWQFFSADNQIQLTVMPDVIVVQTSRYERWSTSMRPLLKTVLRIAAEHHRPELVKRIGLRYVNRFVERGARSAAAWDGKISPTFLGPVLHPTFENQVLQSHQQVELSLGATQGALLRHGPFIDATAAGGVSYLLDTDVFDTEPIIFDVDEVVRRTETLNRTAASIFQQVLTPEYLRARQHLATT